MIIKPVIYTTSRGDWFLKVFPHIYQTVKRAKNLDIEPFTVRRWDAPKQIPVITDKKGDRRIDWKWFEKEFTSKSEGYNCVIMHITPYYRKAWGLEEYIGGTYRADTNKYIEIYMCADREEEFWRVMVHELGHYVERSRDGLNQNHPERGCGTIYDSEVHKADYCDKDLDGFFSRQVITKKDMQSLKMYRPMVSKRISQYFGENKACITARNTIIGTNTTCPVGTRPFYPSVGMKGHNGWDYPAYMGEPVYHCALFDGWMKTETDRAGGIGVDVISNEKVKLADGTEEYVKIRYWHLKAPLGYDGKQVKMGQQIGLAGNTGASSATHLHLGAKVCDKNGVALEKANGYFGAFDFAQYIDNSVDAKTASSMLAVPAPELTPEERKDILRQLSIMRVMVLKLIEIINRIK